MYESEHHEHRLTILKKDIDLELGVLEVMAGTFERFSGASEKHVSKVTARCLSMRTELTKLAGRAELDPATDLLLKEQARQSEMRAEAAMHCGVVRETIALLGSYQKEIGAALVDKRKALQLEKECLVQGSTAGAELVGPSEVDRRGKVSLSKLPRSPPGVGTRAVFSTPSTSRPASPASTGRARSLTSPGSTFSTFSGSSSSCSPFKLAYSPPPLVPGRPRSAFTCAPRPRLPRCLRPRCRAPVQSWRMRPWRWLLHARPSPPTRPSLIPTPSPPQASTGLSPQTLFVNSDDATRHVACAATELRRGAAARRGQRDGGGAQPAD